MSGLPRWAGEAPVGVLAGVAVFGTVVDQPPIQFSYSCPATAAPGEYSCNTLRPCKQLASANGPLC